MLTQIQKLLVTNEVMTAKALAAKLATSEQGLQGMLQLLLQRGQVELVVGGDCEVTCGCVSAKVEAYRWREKKSATALSILNLYVD